MSPQILVTPCLWTARSLSSSQALECVGDGKEVLYLLHPEVHVSLQEEEAARTFPSALQMEYLSLEELGPGAFSILKFPLDFGVFALVCREI